MGDLLPGPSARTGGFDGLPLDGFEVLRRIRSKSRIPVLMLTSLSERKDIAKGLLLGANGYITKPALPSTLIDAVQAIVAG